MRRIQVGLQERTYPILIHPGMLEEVGAELKERNIGKRYIVVADDRVGSLYGAKLMDSLAAASLPADLITFPHGEESKNLATIGQLASSLAGMGVDRKDALIALGGGVTGDITGFLASVYMRGIPFVQIPTTLLAQVDSSVGGKTGVDIPEGKNLVGSFYQPRCVYIDGKVLLDLPAEEMLNGLAEVIKYSIIKDRRFFDYLKKNLQAVQERNLPVLEEIVYRCCSIKAQVVEADEKESDLRRILNFGHTIGHAIEAASGYALAHGLAVSMGMVAAGKIAMGKSLLSEEDLAAISGLIADFGLPVSVPSDMDRQHIKRYLKTDKKAVGGRPFFVLPNGIGKVVITDDVSEELIDQAIR